MRTVIFFVLMLFCIGLLTGATPLDQAERELRIALEADPATLDPQRAVAIADGRIIAELFEGLLTRGPDGKPIPGVAERWGVDADRVTWRFYLRPDAKWADGSAVTAADFVAGWQRAFEPGAFGAEPLAAIAHENGRPAVRADGAHQLVVRLSRPVPDFPAGLVDRVTFPVQHLAAAAGRLDFARPGGFVGNGPYQLAERQPLSHLRLTRNPHFHAARSVAINAVRVVIVPDDRTDYRLFRAGELDISGLLSGTVAAQAAESDPAALHRSARDATVIIAFNLRREPWASDLALRRALSLAIDRQLLTQTVTRGGEVPAQRLVPPGFGLPTATPRWSGGEPREAARRALAAAQPPATLTLLHGTDAATRSQAVAIADFWKQGLGLPTELEAQELTALIRRFRADDHPAMIYLSLQRDQAADFLHQLAMPPADGGIGFTDAAFLEHLERAGRAASAADQARHLAAAEAIALDRAVVIPVYHPAARRLISPSVTGWADNPGEHHPLRFLAFAR